MMARTSAVAAEETLEHGSITFLYRPRVEEQHPTDLGDVQRLLMLLSPADGVFERLIAIGRKRVPRAKGHDRFWGFVDLVLTPDDMHAALGAQVYGTKTRGLRHLPAAQPFAQGMYDLMWHGAHAHLRWHVQRKRNDSVAAHLALERSGDVIVTVANPDPSLWGLSDPPDLQSELFDGLELHVTIPTPFPPSLQQRFRDRRYAQLDTPDWLDHPGAELIFVGAGD
ncbi:MAG: hypothetical protein JO197_03170 [Acidobacteria bacterium]|nr:hypothetical protein [Acidobacteriota bacterium]